MISNTLTGLSKRRLRLWLWLFFFALALPTGILIHQAYSQLKWAAFHQAQQQAESLAGRIDNRFSQLIAAEEVRGYADYAFLTIAGDPAANFLQRSELSGFPVKSSIPGLLSYFQVDAMGRFSTPLLPAEGVEVERYGISAVEMAQRRSLQQQVLKILSDNQLVESRKDGMPYPAAIAPLPEPFEKNSVDGESVSRERVYAGEGAPDEYYSAPEKIFVGKSDVLEEQMISQTVFDRLNQGAEQKKTEMRQKKQDSGLGRVEDLKLDMDYQQRAEAGVVPRPSAPDVTDTRKLRKESSLLPEPQVSSGVGLAAKEQKSKVNIHAFESEIDRFEFNQLDSGHFVIFRKVWRDNARTIQGALIEQHSFLREVVEPLYRETGVSQMSDLIMAFQGNVAVAFSNQQSRGYLSSAEELNGTLLYRTRLSNPFGEMETIFSIIRMPPGAGGQLIGWVSLIIVLILSGGLYLMYRLGLRQIELARQQQDFVSAVSHELKTPLTSIRMYGEMLREGWANEEKRRSYYNYIYEESERLSRLIANVLQLARMTRNELQIELRPIKVSELIDGIHSKISSQVEQAGFTLDIDCAESAVQSSIQVDPDSFSQVIINLVDNAIKFSANGEQQCIEVGCRRLEDGAIRFSVRDFGPGIPKNQMKKIFKLFYRSEDELTRETIGTGIGLALVKQLVSAMNGRVDVINREPGAEFQILIPLFEDY